MSKGPGEVPSKIKTLNGHPLLLLRVIEIKKKKYVSINNFIINITVL